MGKKGEREIMNLKVRMKNWSFWLAIIMAIGVYYGVTGADITSWSAKKKTGRLMPSRFACRCRIQ